MQELWLGSKKLGCAAYILLAYLSFFYSFSLFSFSPLEELNRIPEQDREDLEELFGYFIRQTTFAYTIFGDKPVSWVVLSLPEFPKIKSSKKIIHRPTGKTPLWSKWKIWKLYENRFSLKNYLLIEDTHSIIPRRKDIFLINKQQFIKIVDQYKSIFQKILNREISGESLLQEIERNSSLQSFLNDSDLLLGILLGFGEYNSRLYQQRECLSSAYQQYEPILLKNAPLFKELENKIEALTQTLQPVGNSMLMKISTVQFVADLSSPQTEFLLSKYGALRKQICLLYSTENLLDITLLALTKE